MLLCCQPTGVMSSVCLSSARSSFHLSLDVSISIYIPTSSSGSIQRFCLELKSFYPKEQCHLVALGMAFRETPGEAACIKHEPVFCLVSQYRFILTSCICRAIHLSPVPRHVSNLSPNRLPSFHSPFQVSRFLFAGGKLEREESRN